MVCYSRVEILAPASYGGKRSYMFWREGIENTQLFPFIFRILSNTDEPLYKANSNHVHDPNLTKREQLLGQHEITTEKLSKSL